MQQVLSFPYFKAITARFEILIHAFWNPYMEETKVLGVDQDQTIGAAKIDQGSVERMSCLGRPIMSQSEDTTDYVSYICGLEHSL